MHDAKPAHSPEAEPIAWTSWREAFGVVRLRHHLVRTLTAAVVVGTVLFCINQLDVVMRGDATTAIWVKSATTYLVPFIVANYGVLAATHRPASKRSS